MWTLSGNTAYCELQKMAKSMNLRRNFLTKFALFNERKNDIFGSKILWSVRISILGASAAL